MREVIRQLTDLGLSEKEAAVYLAMLELGPTSVQDIAEKAGVNRTSTYSTIDGLKRHGLVSMTGEQEKIVYTAESPSRLHGIIETAYQDLTRKKQQLDETMPSILALFNAIEHKPRVRFFQGDAGIATTRDMLMLATGEYRSFMAMDDEGRRLGDICPDQRARMARRMSGRFLFAHKPGAVKLVPEGKWRVREIGYDQCPFTGEVNIIDDVVVAYVMRDEPLAIWIQDVDMSRLFAAMYDAAWNGGKDVV